MANDRYKRRKDRNVKTDAAKTLLLLQDSGENIDTPGSPKADVDVASFKDVAVQTDVDSPFLNAMGNELQSLRLENLTLKEKLKKSSSFSLSSFEENDEKVRFYTGLPGFQILMTLFNLLKDYLPSKSIIGKFEGLVMTLARLRLNLSVNQLSYEMNVSASTVSQTFLAVIDVMYIRMKPLVMWPEREALRKTMPIKFQKQFGMKCAVIIDCFEVFIERPSNLKARAETWSSYKHHNTVKFLLGITPQGVVSYISNSWGGRTSDKHITEHCGFLNNILPGDIVLADRGFDIQASLGAMCAEAKIPAFTKGKSQLSPIEVETTRKLANVRIQVERVIGLVCQKYTILNGTLPIDMVFTKDGEVPTIDKIAHVCCALVKLCDSVVEFN